VCDDQLMSESPESAPPATDGNARQRRTAAIRGCDRILSGVRPATMRERLEGADLDALPDFYGDDGPVVRLEERVAELLGTEAAVLFPTGTMAQQVALRYGAERAGYAAVALHPLGHQEMHERHAYAQLSGLRASHPTTEPPTPRPTRSRHSPSR
jgi:7-keto-8-aminopelargonate synthetase-like enzyme